MLAERVAFWCGVVAPPAGMFILNAIVRGKEVMKSSGADWLLLLVAFDIGSLFTITELARFIPNPEIRKVLQPVVIVLFIICIAAWLFVVLRVEPYVQQQGRVSKSKWRAIVAFLFIWAVAIGMTAVHINLFFQNQGAKID